MPITRSGHFIGGYGTQAGGVIDIHWEPDPLVFAEKILDVRDQLADRTLPLFLAGAAISEQIEENFEGEHDPEGQPWAPWSKSEEMFDPVTDRWTKSSRGYADNLPHDHSGMILNWRGILKEAATSPAAMVEVAGQSVNDDSLFFDTGGLPPYWVYHQQPESPNSGKIPQRRFLGISDDVVILEIFDDWFQGIIREAAVTRTGRIIPRRRDPATGRFISADG